MNKFLNNVHKLTTLIAAGSSIYLILFRGVESDLYSVIVGVLIALNVGLFYQVFKYRKFKGYRNSFELFNKAFSNAHRIVNPDISDGALEDDMKILDSFCKHVRSGFEEIHGLEECMVNIEILKYKKSGEIGPIIATFACDSRDRLKEIVDKNPKNIEHLLINNTQFKAIFNPENGAKLNEQYYFSNNLPKEKDYENTRIKDIDRLPSTFKTPLSLMDNYYKRQHWSLEYKSIISVPIIPLSDEKDISDFNLEGFLTIQCKNTKSFDKEYDIEIARGIADGIYSTMRKIREKHFSDKEIGTSD